MTLLKKDTYWTREETRERFPDSISPLGWSILQSALDANLVSIKSEFYLKSLERDQISRWIDGYLYSSKNFFKRIPFYHFSFFGLSKLFFKAVFCVLKALIQNKNGNSFKERCLLNFYFLEIQPKTKKVIESWKMELPNHIIAFNDNLASSKNWGSMSSDFQILMNKIESDGCAYNRLDFAIYFYKNLLRGLMETLAKWKGVSFSFNSLTSESDFQIGKQIKAILKQGASLSSDQSSIFVKEKLGHLSLSWDIAKPTFSEQPELLNKMINQEKQAQDIQTYSVNKANTFPLLPMLAEQFTELVSCDEEHRFYASFQFPMVRKIFLSIAKTWVDRKFISTESEIFFLTLEEVINFHSKFIAQSVLPMAEVRTKILSRRLLIKPNPSELLSSKHLIQKEPLFFSSVDFETELMSASSQNVVWKGQAASSGKSIGLAYWVIDYESLTQCPPEAIVLCETPSPNFNSAFISAKGIISETGGILSHGAIIARELGIPCLLQVSALKSIRNGDLIEVDTQLCQVKRVT